MSLQKLYAMDIVLSSYPTLEVSETEPSYGVIPAVGRLPYLRVQAIMTDAANETGELEVVGWSQDDNGFWVPTLMGRVTVTAGTFTGATGALASASQLFADGYAVTEDTGFGDRLEVGGNTADLPGALLINPLAFARIQVRAKVGTAASINVLWETMGT